VSVERLRELMDTWAEGLAAGELATKTINNTVATLVGGRQDQRRYQVFDLQEVS
jgi:hypothetical protein